jgi:hypothetical protein
MKESYQKGVAKHLSPESCLDDPRPPASPGVRPLGSDLKIKDNAKRESLQQNLRCRG